MTETQPKAKPAAVVVGAGPAGLMAAWELASAGLDVTVFEAKPSVARKLLMAGKSGLNLTRDEPFDQLITAYGDAAGWLAPMLRAFDSQAVQRWASGLGQDLFTGSTGRVFPCAMKASPLLRAWLGELEALGVTIRTRRRWRGWDDGALVLDAPDGAERVRADATVLALGGASWARLGSDGAWADILRAQGVDIAPFAPANAGITVRWSPHMRPLFGQPIKGVAFIAGMIRSRGEAILSERGLEGGGVYPLSPALRDGAALHVDLAPDLTAPEIADRLSRASRKPSLSNRLRKALKLGPVRTALLQEFTRPLPGDPATLAQRIKSLPVTHDGLRPLDEAISTAGGVRRDALDAGLMLTACPGVFCAGEMLDWEAPTGGYLLTACLATGRWAGRAAAARVVTRPAPPSA